MNPIAQSNEEEVAKLTLSAEEAEQWVRNYIKSVSWRPAKTYAKTAPHEYHWEDGSKTDHDNLVQFGRIIRKYGYSEHFYSKTFWYYNVDGKKYWGHPQVSRTDSINRTQIENTYGH